MGRPDDWDEENEDLTNGHLRLMNGDEPSLGHQGRVEVFYQFQWGSVCDDGLEDGGEAPAYAAQVICRQLGYSGGVALVWSVRRVTAVRAHLDGQP